MEHAGGTRKILALSMAASAFLFAAHDAAAESARGAELAAMCAACHRFDGRDRGIPSIVGLDQQRFTELMEAFRSGKRSSQIMNVVARSLSTEEVAALAAYLGARQKGSKEP